jgi:hypothetical protein
MTTEAEYRAEQAARQNLTEHTLKVTESVPTPTQEELDLMRLGLLHPDDVKDPGNPQPLPLKVQQAYVQNAIEHSDVPVKPVPEPQPPVNVTVPYVGGEGAVDARLTCTMGTWDGEPTDYAYRWKRDGTTDLGVGDNYVVKEDDAGHSITCVVTATNAAGSTEAPPSNAVAINGGGDRETVASDTSHRARRDRA